MKEFDSEFELVLCRHFTSEELVQYLEIPVDTILDRFEDEIFDKYEELCWEIGYEESEV